MIGLIKLKIVKQKDVTLHSLIITKNNNISTNNISIFNLYVCIYTNKKNKYHNLL